MRVLVTGALGKVGAAAVAALHEAGHEVTGCDLRPPVYEAGGPPRARYLQADLSDAGDAYAAVRGHDAVIHAAALPEPTRNPPHRTFAGNLTGVFNVVEAAVRFHVPRLVNVSSETVPGFFFNERPDRPDYLPVDEGHPARPQDPYALAKHFGEQICDAAARRSDIRCLSIRPSWVQWEGNYERNLGPAVRNPEAASGPTWSYIDIYDLADALLLATESDIAGHEVLYVVSPDNTAGLPLADLVRRSYGDDVPVQAVGRPDAAGTSHEKARRLLGYAPTRSWRDYLDADGRLRAEAADRVRTGATGVQRGRALLS